MTSEGEGQNKVLGDTVLAMIRTKYPGYHPIMAIAELAHGPEVDDRLALDCHKTIARYVQPELKSVEVKATVTEHRRVIVSLFGETEPVATQPAALEGQYSKELSTALPNAVFAEDPLADQLIDLQRELVAA